MGATGEPDGFRRVPSPDAGGIHLGLLCLASVPSVQFVAGVYHAGFVRSVFTALSGQRRFGVPADFLAGLETQAMACSAGVVDVLPRFAGAGARADRTPALPK